MPDLSPFLFWLGGEPPTKIDYRRKSGFFILTSRLEDLERELVVREPHFLSAWTSSFLGLDHSLVVYRKLGVVFPVHSGS